MISLTFDIYHARARWFAITTPYGRRCWQMCRTDGHTRFRINYTAHTHVCQDGRPLPHTRSIHCLPPYILPSFPSTFPPPTPQTVGS